MKKIAIGSDHAGYELKEKLIKRLQKQDFTIIDKGTDSSERTDYPDYAHAVARSVKHHEAPIGILVCGSANGVCMTANKHIGIRAAIAWNTEIATLAREHNNANIVCLPARFIADDNAYEIVQAFLAATFEGGRHSNRVNKIDIREE